MPLYPPFTIHEVTPQNGHGKRCAVGTDTGITLAPGAVPAATFHIKYRENFRIHRIYKLESVTPFWAAEAEGKWATTPRAGILPPGTLIVQVQPSDAARKKASLGNKAQTELVLGQIDSAALASDFTPKHKQVWVPIRNHPDNDKDWAAPQLLKHAPVNVWGITGDFDVMVDPYRPSAVAKHFKMVTVWERWTRCISFPCEKDGEKGPARWSSGLFTLRPGVYAGYIKVMPRHSSDDERKKFPSIKVAWGWDERLNTWVEDAPSAKNAATRVPGCFIHPGSKPTAFLGCLSPGPIDKATPWGFWQVKHCRDAMWSIMEDIGVNEEEFVRHKFPSAKTAKWVLIRVDDPDDVCGIQAAGRSAWLETGRSRRMDERELGIAG